MWRKIPDWLIYLAIIIALYAYANRTSDKIDALPPPPELGPMLPNETPRDERVIVNVERAGSGIGTAFAIDDTGRWMTARHVVDSCDQVGIDIGGRQVLRVDSYVSKDSDTAILTGSWARKPLANDLFTNRQIGERGFFFGFPQGRPGEVVGALLARNRMIIRGRYKSEEGILAWSEVGRTKGLSGSLGGLSGAPVMDKDGEVIGVVSAESPRRGRIYTVAPENLQDLIKDRNIKAEALSLNSYGIQADRLRRERRIAQVICIVR
ncbi:serine protease [Hellea sp.]|nr:serine protease [Hellea sp.]